MAYPCLKPLGSWFKDYLRRIDFLRTWLTAGQPDCFWLPGFFFPQGFLTGVLQMHARKHCIPIDSLAFQFSVTASFEATGVRRRPAAPPAVVADTASLTSVPARVARAAPIGCSPTPVHTSAVAACTLATAQCHCSGHPVTVEPNGHRVPRCGPAGDALPCHLVCRRRAHGSRSHCAAALEHLLPAPLGPASINCTYTRA